MDEKPFIDPHISFGSLLAILTLVVTVGLAYAGATARFASLEARLNSIDAQLTVEREDHDAIVKLSTEFGLIGPKAGAQ
jgi:hypothetical protein